MNLANKSQEFGKILTRSETVKLTALPCKNLLN
jgi:hypothetical protein